MMTDISAAATTLINEAWMAGRALGATGDRAQIDRALEGSWDALSHAVDLDERAEIRAFIRGIGAGRACR